MHRWHRLCGRRELSCTLTLGSGQCFNWRQLNSNEWIGVLASDIVQLKEDQDGVYFHMPASTRHSSEDKMKHVLVDYFRLDIPLQPLYEEWSTENDKMSQVIQGLPGYRLLRQDPLECFYSFLCSSNNNIARIHSMLEKFRREYGIHLPTIKTIKDEIKVEKHQQEEPVFYSFPSVSTLIERCTEADLRKLGFGYRARYIYETTQLLDKLGGAEYLENLREHEHPQTELRQFTGIGQKVADCIALFSLDQMNVIPVDTHVWQIACRDFDPTLNNVKSLTPKVYSRVNQLFCHRFPRHSGWAHSILFAAELPAFSTSSVLPKQKKRKQK